MLFYSSMRGLDISWRLSSKFVLLFLLHHVVFADQTSRVVIECGGFIRWNANVDQPSSIAYDRTKVHLYTQHTGTLKETTDVLPNGAFSVPVYDFRNYRLTLSVPKGWIIDPSDGYAINLQEDSNACSKDFNFVLQGFSIYGQVVTQGLNSGPSGLSVNLFRSGTRIMQNHTHHDGYFSLAPVLPGQYELTINDNASNHARARINVTVESDTVTLAKPFVLMGHFLRGVVVDLDNRPLSGSMVYLLAHDVTQTAECNHVSTLPDEVRSVLPDSNRKFGFICSTQTRSDGSFSFDAVPGGEYFILPFSILPSTIHVSFRPSYIHVTMGHENILLDAPSFIVDGLKFPPGRVLWPNGKPIASAKVNLDVDPSHSIQTDSTGSYQPGFLKTGHITFTAEADGAHFLPREFHLTSSSERLPDLIPDKISVCGRVQLAEPADSILQATMLLLNQTTGSVEASVSMDRSGPAVYRFCAYLPPGPYEVKPEFSSPESTTRFLHVVPSSFKIDLRNGPVLDLVFTQFRARLTGRVVCLTPACSQSTATAPSLVVRLRSIESSNESEIHLATVVFDKTENRDGRFTLDNIVPGDYHVELSAKFDQRLEPVDGWCWNSSQPHLRVQDTDLDWTTSPALNFVQIGYVIPVHLVSSFHFDQLPPIRLQAQRNNDTFTWDVTAPVSKICLPPSNASYRFAATSSCLGLNSPLPDQLKVTGYSHTINAHTPSIQLTVNSVPIFVRLGFEEQLTAAEKSAIVEQPVLVEMELDGSQTHAVNTITANWSSVDEYRPVAEAIYWIPVNDSVLIKPRPSTVRRAMWHYTYIVNATHLARATPVANPVSPMSNVPVSSQCDGMFPGQSVYFNLHVGVVLRGQIQPPVAKVEVELFEKQLSTDHPDDQLPLLPIQRVPQTNNVSDDAHPIATTLSDPQGFFTLGPVRCHGKCGNPRDVFHVRLHKAGFEFVDVSTSLKDNAPINWLLRATQLSLVEVIVQENIGSEKVALKDVLISIIGQGHRGSLFTDASGMASFVGLAPDQYYVRAMMKEYSFTVVSPKPSSSGQASPIVLQQGSSVRVVIQAVRIAYSYSGVVQSLSGIPLANISVEAQWLPKLPAGGGLSLSNMTSAGVNHTCELISNSRADSVPREQAHTDSEGRFRIRGLLPGCFYAISVLPSATVSACSATSEPSVHHALPSVHYIHQSANDMTGLRFIAVPRMIMTSLLVNVHTSEQHYPSLHLTVSLFDRPEHVLIKHSFSSSPIFRLPQKLMCDVLGRQVVVRLENSLDPLRYTELGPHQVILKPQLNRSEHHTFYFRPKLVSTHSNPFRTEL